MERLVVPCALLVALAAGADRVFLQPVENPAFPTYGGTYGATLLDADADGRLDIFLSRHTDRPFIYLNRGELGFEACAEPQTPPLRDHHASSAFDVDRDGRDDVYLTVGARRGKGEGFNGMWTWTGPCRYADLAPNSPFLADSRGRGRGALWLDADGDGAPELLVFNFDTPSRLFEREEAWHDRTSWLPPHGVPAGKGNVPRIRVLSAAAGDLDGKPGMEVMVCGPQGFLLRFDEVLHDVTAATGLGGKQNNTVQAAFADVDRDGDLDLLLARRDRVETFFNDGGFPLRTGPALALPEGPDHLVGLQVADLDNDGLHDLVLALRRSGTEDAANRVARGDGTGAFAWARAGLAPLGNPSTCVWAVDLDADGDLDTVSVQGFGVGGEGPTVQVHRNVTEAAGVTIQLMAADGGPARLGTRVRLTGTSRMLVEEIRGVATPLNAAVLPVHFGVDTAAGPFHLQVEPLRGDAWEAEIPAAGGAYRCAPGRPAERIDP